MNSFIVIFLSFFSVFFDGIHNQPDQALDLKKIFLDNFARVQPKEWTALRNEENSATKAVLYWLHLCEEMAKPENEVCERPTRKLCTYYKPIICKARSNFGVPMDYNIRPRPDVLLCKCSYLDKETNENVKKGRFFVAQVNETTYFRFITTSEFGRNLTIDGYRSDVPQWK